MQNGTKHQFSAENKKSTMNLMNLKHEFNLCQIIRYRPAMKLTGSDIFGSLITHVVGWITKKDSSTLSVQQGVPIHYGLFLISLD